MFDHIVRVKRVLLMHEDDSKTHCRWCITAAHVCNADDAIEQIGYDMTNQERARER
jgi:hypothetical protein